MLDIAKKLRMVTVAVRIPPEIRDKARDLAAQKEVKESDVLRAIITDFFSANRIRNVYGKVDESSTIQQERESA